MKKMSALIVILFTSLALSLSYSPVLGQEEPTEDPDFHSYRGIVKDSETSDPLPFAAVTAVGSNIATVTNIDGEFLLKVSKSLSVDELKISYIGYENQNIETSQFAEKDEVSISLEPAMARIKELTIRPVNGPEFIDEVLRQVVLNYNPEPQMMTGFYRETIKNRRNYVSISEAVVEIYKSGYKNSLQLDQVRIDKGRKSANVEKMDTVMFKLQGGPAVSLMMDVVKNPYVLLTDQYEKVYDFELDNVVSIDNRLHYIVSFKQKPFITDPYYYGKLFIDMDQLAISAAEFSLNIEDENKAARFFIEKKPMSMSLIPEKATYKTSYGIQDGQWYFKYARAEVKFKVKWDKRLFNSSYSIMSEIAITDRKSGMAEKIDFKDRFKRHEILDEMVYVYFEPDYWGAYNVIEPDQSIESAIRKLNRKFDKN